MSKNPHLPAAYRQLKLNPQPVVLATIIETFGSTYQKAGARMLIAQDDILTGLLGGGCFEHDLIEHARSVFQNGIAKTVFYDMRSPDDAVWGLGLGCNGVVKIYLQLLNEAEDFSPLNLIANAAETHQSGLLVTICESTHPDFPAAHSLFLPVASIGHPQNTTLPWSAFPEKSRLETHVIAQQTIRAFYDRVQPPSQLLLIGAGADALPLVDCAKALSWRVTVADHRPGYANSERFPNAERVQQVIPEELSTILDLSQLSAVVLMTHHLDYDRRFLQAIVASPIPFIGLLGPAQRRERLLLSLGGCNALRSRVHGPVGLDIGAQTPAEIALSIMAGIHAALKGCNGGQLSIKNTAESYGSLLR
ncbi:MAG: XdhC family protein [Methylobacter sp.]|nr:XdhC family protein [Methylobacter sp.]